MNTLSRSSLCILSLPLLLAGCGRSEPQPVPVKGTVTFGGGPWPKPGKLYFTVGTSSPGMPNRPGVGEFDTDGRFTVTTFTKGDGLLPGTYKIGVECWDVPPRMGSPISPRSYVPARYSSAATSGLTAIVEPGQRIVTLNLDVAKE